MMVQTQLSSIPEDLESTRTVNAQVRSYLEEHTSADFWHDNEESMEYLCEMIASKDFDKDMLNQMLGQFFENRNTSIEQMSRDLENILGRDGARERLAPVVEKEQMKSSQETVAQEDQSEALDNSKEKSAKPSKLASKRLAREERKLKKRLAKKQSRPQDNELLDDHDSAWQDFKAQGKSWGGRGHGGRGVRSEVNTARNIHLPSVSLQFAGNELLENSTIQINGGHRYGLVGRNGCGKTTLLRKMAKKDIPGFPQHLRVLFVQQQLEGSTTQSAIETLVNADQGRAALLDEQEALEQELDQAVQNDGDLDEIVKRLEMVSTELDATEAYNAEERAREILTGLQFSESMMEGPTANLSGGWRMRLALAQALFVPSDLLLFDEPTNHLDFHALIWLTNYLQQSQHTIIVVSHDRVFLDICTDIISFQNKKLKYHVGNYSAFAQQQQEYAARQAQILDASERQRQKAMTFVQQQQKKTADPNKQRQAKMIKEKKLDRIGNFRDDGKRYKAFSLKTLSEDSVRLAQKVVVEPDEPVVKFKFPNPTWPPGMQTGTALVKMDNLRFSYHPQEEWLLENVTLDLNRGSKVAVVGRNGAGKSTLIKLITGELDDKTSYGMKGQLWKHPNLRVGHVTQHSVEDLEFFADMTVVEYAEQELKSGCAFDDITKAASGNIRQYLGAFGLGGKHAHRRISSLSGGERMRLCFATVLAQKPHLLVCDEPTNHLDMESLDSLALALDAFEGAVVIVSHNQGFLCGFCNELWVVDNGNVDVRHNDTQSFEELFNSYKQNVMVGAQQRLSARQEKARLARRAQKQRAGASQSGGFIS